MSDPGRRVVHLRNEHQGYDHRYLDAYLNESGDLVIRGQDLGPATAPVSDDGEYEWFHTIPAAAIPAMLTLLDAQPEADVLQVLQEEWTGVKAGELERRIRESNLPVRRWVWNG